MVSVRRQLRRASVRYVDIKAIGAGRVEAMKMTLRLAGRTGVAVIGRAGAKSDRDGAVADADAQ